MLVTDKCPSIPINEYWQLIMLFLQIDNFVFSSVLRDGMTILVMDDGLYLRDRVRRSDIQEESRVVPLILFVKRSRLMLYRHVVSVRSGHLPGKIILAWLARRNHQGRPSAWLDWESLGVLQEKLVEVFK